MEIPDPKYIAMFPLQEVIHDKDTGELLAAGTVRFWSDPQWTVPKDVYQQSQTSSGTYVFTNMGNVITLNSIGAMADNNGTDIIPFLYPYDDDGALELYFIQVYSAGGVRQFTREGWPPSMLTNITPTSNGETVTANELTNPQFIEVLFGSPAAYVFNVVGTNTETQIAPGWFIQTSGSGSVTVQQIATAETDIPSQPPYLLDIQGSAGVTTLNLVQRLTASPRLLSGRFVAGYFVARTQGGTASIPLTLNYIPSNTGATPAVIATGSTTGGTDFEAIKGNVAIVGAPNADTAPTGYVDISLSIPSNTHIQVSSFQILGTPALLDNTSLDLPGFIQLSTPQQINDLFYYYKPKLIYKPIPSYLVGWDFPLNPAQPLGSTVAVTATTANKSHYVWDQTIIFQTVDSSIDVLRSTTTGGLQIHAALGTSFAIIQYLPQAQAREILSQHNAIQIQGAINTGTLNGTVSMYWTTDASLPDIKTPTFNSLVSSITAGVPATTNGTWNKVARNTLSNPATFTLTTTNQSYDFVGFDDTASSGKTTATFFAIVIAFDTMTLDSSVTIDYCSLVGGDIATRPAPQTYQAVLSDCQYYYETSYAPVFISGYPSGTVPGTASSYLGAVITTQPKGGAGGSFNIRYLTEKRVIPSNQVYAPVSGAANFVTYAANVSGTITPIDVIFSNWTGTYLTHSTASTKSADYFAANGDPLNPTANQTDSFLFYHWTSNAQLGVI